MKRLFTEHPASVGETYGEHFVFATTTGLKMIRAGLACCAHGFLPFVCVTTGSRAIRELALSLTPANRRKPSPAHATPLFTKDELESLTSASL